MIVSHNGIDKRRARILDAIRDGRAWTCGHIAHVCESPTVTVWDDLRALERKGFVRSIVGSRWQIVGGGA